MKWRTLQRRPYLYLLLAALAITFVAGTLSSTAYATFRGPDIKVQNFSVTYVGVTGPMDSLPQGRSNLVLTQASGRFVNGERSEMIVSIERHRIIGTRLSSKGPCDVPNVPGKMKAWCVDERQNGNIESVTERNESGPLLRRGDIERAGHGQRLCRRVAILVGRSPTQPSGSPP